MSFENTQAKGSFKIMEDDVADALSVDFVIPRSSCKPEFKKPECVRQCPTAAGRISGQYSTGRVVIGIREISRELQFSSSYTLVEHAPLNSIETEIKPIAMAAVEKVTRKSLDILASQMADGEISQANPEAFQRTFLADASWDTLGFILLKENKLDEARDYLEAAWRNRPEAENTLHYGALQEALGNRKEAMRIYATMAPPSGQALGANVNPTYVQIGDRVKHLEAEGMSRAKMGSAIDLQQERTFKVTLKASNSYWSATYRVQLDANGAADAMQVGRLAPREGVVQAIKRLAFPHLVPKGFKGSILRDAVISCSSGKTECEFVLMPMGSMAAEGSTQ